MKSILVLAHDGPGRIGVPSSGAESDTGGERSPDLHRFNTNPGHNGRFQIRRCRLNVQQPGAGIDGPVTQLFAPRPFPWRF